MPIPGYRSTNKYKRYSKNLMKLFGTSLIAYWPLWDAGGASAAELIAGRSAVYHNNTAGDGVGDKKSAAVSGASSYISPYSAGLNAAMPKDELTVLCWAKLDPAAWTDGAYHFAFRFGADDNNAVFIQRTPANNNLRFEYNAGATLKYTDFVSPAYTDWMHLAITVSKSADRMYAYLNGSRILAAGVSGLGTWGGALSNTYTGIGSRFGAAASLPWLGSLAHVLILNRAASAVEIAQAAAGPKASSPRGILFVGDSKIAADWQYLLFDQLNVAPFVQWTMTPSKIGVSGATAADIAARTAADIAAMTYSPSEILINLGANDINGALLSANWQTNMTAIINAYHTAFPVANLRLAKVWKRGGSAGGTQASHAIIDALYSANPWLKPGIDEAFLEGGDDGATYTTDGTHPNAAGQVLEANAWKSAIGG